jgi:hypothetical protein
MEEWDQTFRHKVWFHARELSNANYIEHHEMVVGEVGIGYRKYRRWNIPYDSDNIMLFNLYQQS